MSRVFARANDTDNAIASQQRAFETFASMEKYEETDYLAEIATTLSELQDKAKMFHEALDSLRAVERILEHNHAGEISAKEWHVYLRGSATVFEREKQCDYISDECF